MFDAISLSGVSGTGKATLCKNLIDLWPDLFVVAPSITTRPSKTEVHGKVYAHVDHETFEALIGTDELLEYNKYPTQNGFNYYGSLRTGYEEIISLGKIALFDLDINGAKQLKEKLGAKLFSIFLGCEMEEIERRLRARNSENEEQIQARLKTGRFELEQIPQLEAVGIINKVVWYGKGSIPGITANEILNFALKKQALV